MTTKDMIELGGVVTGWILAFLGFLRYRSDKRASDAKAQTDLAAVGNQLVDTMKTVLDTVKSESEREIATLKAKVDLLQTNAKDQQQQYIETIAAHRVEIAKKDLIIESLNGQLRDLARRVAELEGHEAKPPAPPMTVTVTSA